MDFIKKNAWLILALMVLVGGCAPKVSMPSVTLDRYDLYSPAGLKTISKWDENFYQFNDKGVRITLNIIGYQGLLVVPIDIYNGSKENIDPAEYHVGLFDGRDQLPIKMITRDDINKIKNKNNASGGFSLASPSLQGAVGSFNSLVNFPANSALEQQLQFAINNYFEFRPIYAGETRSGFIAFFHDFKLEYPLLFKIKIRNKEYLFYFKPQAVK